MNNILEKVMIAPTLTGGWTVTRFTNTRAGRDGVLVATLCGGNMGRILAAKCAAITATMGMIDVIELVDELGNVTTFAPTEIS